MPADFHLKFSDESKIKGESTAEGHVGEIEILSFSWGASNPTTVGSGTTGLTAGKVSISSFNIMIQTSAASARLFAACAAGQHFTSATFTARRATGTDGGQKTYLQYIFTDVMVESYQVSGSEGGGNPSESVSLAYGKVAIEYFKQGAKVGTMESAGTASWDLTKVAKQ